MLVIVVNELLRGGWLEHLLGVWLERGCKFDRDAKLSRLKKDAAAEMLAGSGGAGTAAGFADREQGNENPVARPSVDF